MSEFGTDWPGHVFRTAPENVESRMLDPDEGIALVETGIDVHRLLKCVGEHADAMIEQAHRRRGIRFDPRSEAAYDWYSGCTYPELDDYYSHASDLLGKLCTATADIKQGVETALWVPEVKRTYDSAPVHGTIVTVVRRAQLTPRHVDYWRTTIWCGSTQPAFKVLYRGEWVQIDDVPAGHGLWMRGEFTNDQVSRLPAVRHTAPYRSKTRRATVLS